MLQVPPGWWGSFHSIQADKQLHIYLAQTRTRACLSVCECTYVCVCARVCDWGVWKIANDALKGHMSGSASLQFVNGWKYVCILSYCLLYDTGNVSVCRVESIKVRPRTHLRAELISSRPIVSSDLYSSTSKRFKDIPVMPLLVFFLLFLNREGKPCNLLSCAQMKMSTKCFKYLAS